MVLTLVFLPFFVASATIDMMFDDIDPSCSPHIPMLNQYVIESQILAASGLEMMNDLTRSRRFLSSYFGVELNQEGTAGATDVDDRSITTIKGQ